MSSPANADCQLAVIPRVVTITGTIMGMNTPMHHKVDTSTAMLIIISNRILTTTHNPKVMVDTGGPGRTILPGVLIGIRRIKGAFIALKGGWVHGQAYYANSPKLRSVGDRIIKFAKLVAGPGPYGPKAPFKRR
ncbi:hypothetical protein TCAL_14501 [Tigriopus californicus]|uniref:Uncharacterized protein n=1 Tax=Tigriopus californicus TaxID=6832 RepID=A0A553PT93_TIGCA|nr:hypothetical protein TCAL_14501 [Tigriopus californicus]